MARDEDAGGGSAIFANRELYITQPTSIEDTTIARICNADFSFHIFNVYRKPGTRLSPFLQKIELHIYSILSTFPKSPIILIGDFNVNIRSTKTTREIQQLTAFCTKWNLHLKVPEQPTFHRLISNEVRESTLDILIHSDDINAYEENIPSNMLSDHRPISYIIQAFNSSQPMHRHCLSKSKAEAIIQSMNVENVSEDPEVFLSSLEEELSAHRQAIELTLKPQYARKQDNEAIASASLLIDSEYRTFLATHWK